MQNALADRAPLPLRRPARLLRLASDERLVALARAGEDNAFEAIYDRHHGPILGFCRHMLGSREEAEDALQHTFLAAYGDLIASAKPIDLRPWLFAIARNRCLSLLRARREHVALELVEPATDGLAATIERREDLRELLADLARLPEDQRAALLLAELGALDHAGIATVLGCPREKVKALVFQARSSLAASREARATPCEQIRIELASASGGALRRGPLRRHLHTCEGCRAFKAHVASQRKLLALALPVVPSAALKAGVLTSAGIGGHGGAGAGATAAAAAGAGGGAATSGTSTLGGVLGAVASAGTAKLAVSAAVAGVLAGGGVLAIHADHHRQPAHAILIHHASAGAKHGAPAAVRGTSSAAAGASPSVSRTASAGTIDGASTSIHTTGSPSSSARTSAGHQAPAAVPRAGSNSQQVRSGTPGHPPGSHPSHGTRSNDRGGGSRPSHGGAGTHGGGAHQTRPPVSSTAPVRPPVPSPHSPGSAKGGSGQGAAGATPSTSGAGHGNGASQGNGKGAGQGNGAGQAPAPAPAHSHRG